MNLSLIVEIVVAGLLLVTAGYCFVLDRKLTALRSGQDGLRDVISSLDAAAQQAQASILHLKATGQKAGAELERSIAHARRLSDELSVMVEAGDRIASRLEGAVDGQGPRERGDDQSPDLELVREAVERISGEEESDDWSEHVREKIISALGGVR